MKTYLVLLFAVAVLTSPLSQSAAISGQATSLAYHDVGSKKISTTNSQYQMLRNEFQGKEFSAQVAPMRSY